MRWDKPVGWRADTTARISHLQGVGRLRLVRPAVRQLRRLQARGGPPVTLRATNHRAGTSYAWRTSLMFRDVAADRQPPTGRSRVVGVVRRGVTVTAATPDGGLLTTPPWGRKAAERTAGLQLK